MDDSQLLRYARHIMLKSVGYEGQAAISQARALVLGAGGLGCAAAAYLASSGVAQIILVDDDRVELSNLQRQILHTEASLGLYKVDSAQRALRERNSTCAVIAVHERADAALLHRLLPQVDVALDCSDNYATRQLLNAQCVAERVPLVSGAALEMAAQVALYDVRQASCPCYACVFAPEHAPLEARCADMGVFAPLVGLVGTLQAALALQSVMAQHGGPAPPYGQLWQIDLGHWSFAPLQLQRDPHCRVCAGREP